MTAPCNGGEGTAQELYNSIAGLQDFDAEQDKDPLNHHSATSYQTTVHRPLAAADNETWAAAQACPGPIKGRRAGPAAATLVPGNSQAMESAVHGCSH